MKIIKISLLSIITLLSVIIASDKEEIKTFVKDGITYNVNLSSNHITTEQEFTTNKKINPYHQVDLNYILILVTFLLWVKI